MVKVARVASVFGVVSLDRVARVAKVVMMVTCTRCKVRENAIMFLVRLHRPVAEREVKHRLKD